MPVKVQIKAALSAPESVSATVIFELPDRGEVACADTYRLGGASNDLWVRMSTIYQEAFLLGALKGQPSARAYLAAGKNGRLSDAIKQSIRDGVAVTVDPAAFEGGEC